MRHKKIKVTVFDIDKNRGEFWVRASDGSRGIIYACNIPGKKTWFAETACMYFDENEVIDVYQDKYGFIIPITPGKFDKEKWNSLDHNRLAFRCDKNGKAINGLFAK